MPPFVFGRFITLVGALLMLIGALLAMYRTGEILRGMPVLGIALHGVIFYAAYLTYYFSPTLTFNLQMFSNWGSVLLFQVFWTFTLITWDVATDWFSGWVLPHVIAIFQGGRVAR